MAKETKKLLKGIDALERRSREAYSEREELSSLFGLNNYQKTIGFAQNEANEDSWE